MKSLLLRPTRERSVLLHHPWVFSGSIAQLQGKPDPGETVAVRGPQGNFLGWAAYSPDSKIAARMWSWDETEKIDADFFRRRLQAALDLRRVLVLESETNALRLVHAESDGLPGLVVDRYADLLVVQFLSTGAELWRDTLLEQLVDLTGIQNIYERSDVEVRQLEGLAQREGPLRGDGPFAPLVIREGGFEFIVDPTHGQKTGFYIDQRRNRLRLGQCSAGRDVLNCFCYTGAFSVYALGGGARSVLSIDTSGEALSVARENMARNGLDGPNVEWLEADVFPGAARLPRPAAQLRSDRARPAQVRPHCRPGGTRRAWVQGYQPAGLPAAAARRAAVYLFLLGRHLGGTVPKDCLSARGWMPG